MGNKALKGGRVWAQQMPASMPVTQMASCHMAVLSAGPVVMPVPSILAVSSKSGSQTPFLGVVLLLPRCH